MYKGKVLKSLVVGTMVTSFSVVPMLYANASEVDDVSESITISDEDVTGENFKEIESIKVFTNQQLFDALEAEGYKLTDIFTQEEIEYYKAQDKLRAGKTQWVGHKDGSATLYLSSAYTKTIKVLGSAAAGAIGAVAGGGIASGALAGLLGGMVAENIDGSKGIYIEFSQDPNHIFYPSGWGYQ